MHSKPVNGILYTVQGEHSAGQNSVDNMNMAVSSTQNNVTFVQVGRESKECLLLRSLCESLNLIVAR